MTEQKAKEYLQTIYTLQMKGPVRGSYIAKEMNVSKPTVSVALKMMVQDGYLTMERDHSVRMTDTGRALAEAAIRETVDRGSSYHELLDKLGTDWNVSDDTGSDVEQRMLWLRKERAEGILEALLILSGRFYCVRPIDIAHYLKKTNSVLKGKIQKLADKGFLSRDENTALVLTETGREAAERIYRSHSFFRDGLIEAGVPKDIAEMEACRLEHSFTVNVRE